MSNILSMSANQIVEKLKDGEISCVDLCKEYIKRKIEVAREIPTIFFVVKI